MAVAYVCRSKIAAGVVFETSEAPFNRLAHMSLRDFVSWNLVLIGRAVAQSHPGSQDGPSSGCRRQGCRDKSCETAEPCASNGAQLYSERRPGPDASLVTQQILDHRQTFLRWLCNHTSGRRCLDSARDSLDRSRSKCCASVDAVACASTDMTRSRRTRTGGAMRFRQRPKHGASDARTRVIGRSSQNVGHSTANPYIYARLAAAPV